MNCNEVRDNLSLYIDNELSEEEKKLMDEHLDNCPECRSELEDYRKLIQMLNELPDEEPPAGYCDRLHKKLMKAASEDIEATKTSDIQEVYSKRSGKFKWMKYGSLAAAFVLVLLVYSLNNARMGKSSNEMSYDTAEAPSEMPQEYIEESGTAPESATEEQYFIADTNNLKAAGVRGEENDSIDSNQSALTAESNREMKIIKSASLYLQTKDYNEFFNEINTKISSMGGFIENNITEVYQVYEDKKLMRGNLKVRIPQEDFYELVSYLEENSDVKRKSISEKDATKEYYEKDNKVKNLEIQEQHLRDLFEKASTVEEMLKIENELRRVRTEIDALNVSLADIDDRASMSTIDLDVEEVREVNFTLKSEKGIWERAKEGFINTVNSIVRGFGNMVVAAVTSSPILIPIIIIFIVLLLKIKKYWKKKM
ncbi:MULTISPECIES: DUF4349 domain-containing protein [unclassified Sedimentibacter]|uniref:DUF4349 domain-containing protein n=1 Tax=unclassified Sedimentibacter TaxID=2649220 RepID=UPI0027DFF376|nr:DUF4349 domain-containing protein [Sedimentibacter sp. MB35-C1]WMJ78944.1 DUF4349 domain-containing protein [Sedimentibacter sp. MB35-C1]